MFVISCSAARYVETLAVVIVAEVVEPRLGDGFGVQYIGVEWAVERHRRHHVADRLGLLAEAWLSQVVEVDDRSLTSVPDIYRSSSRPGRLMLL